MTKSEYRSYLFDDEHDPSDEQLSKLMERATEKVKESKQKCDEEFFAALRRAAGCSACSVSPQAALSAI